MAGIYTPFRDLICPFCFMEITQLHASNDEEGELATHIRNAHPNADLYATYKLLSQTLKLSLPENLTKETCTPAVLQGLCQYLATTKGLRKLRNILSKTVRT
ncbi:MAG: hypothetical protein QME59_03935 [Candidatus Hydrothermarchaeota archaeon]|nr:hypothetical protein [Candidatus Hydrothermarchaeota archaeon]